MEYSYLENRRLIDALTGYAEFLKPLLKPLEKEVIPVSGAYGRITARACFAQISSPHYNACAMDGIAVRAKDTFGAGELSPVTLSPDMFRHVDTGDLLPEGFDAVIMIEDVVFLRENAEIRNATYAWQHIRQIGEDLSQGDMILPSYTRLSPAAVGALLAGGVKEIEVFRKLRIGIIPTGDELLPASEIPEKGKILEFNSHMLAAALAETGSEAVCYGIVRDKPELLKQALLLAAQETDIVIINAGSSAGRDDYTRKIIEETGAVFCHGIAIRPGKPTILGACGHVPVIGLPGYPVSAAIVLEQVVFNVIEMFTKNIALPRDTVTAELSRRVVSSLKYEEFLRVKIGYIDGKYVATPLERGAGAVTSLAKADGIVVVPCDSEGLEAGEIVEVALLKPIYEIKRALVVTGSHDPMVDLIGDIMRKQTEFSLSSAHVGSMGGIMAMLRGEAHIAPIHLLDTATGKYNTSYVEKYFGGDVTLIKGVKRAQGIMVKKGNPKKIENVIDIAAEGISYVNRQKGAGTRILFDFLLEKSGVTQSDIYGYENEEYTHTAVAAKIAGGNADAGMGIYAAAKIFGLDFIHIADEEYDFLVKNDMLDLPQIKAFKDALHSDELKSRLAELGGYIFE